MSFLLERHKSWESIEKIEVLNHRLNFSNWTDVHACKGKWKIETQEGESIEKELSIYMPTARLGEPHSGYQKVYSGKMQILANELLIWQNSHQPVKLDYSETDGLIQLLIFQHLITFVSA